ncbi:hypothetical protein P3X46_020638 [Hevea brasiliensis]|uniref:PGG domain-containing protein n=1 Tax=Hevea brasiliensis TaxID=3981 RepID=A0ABQ9LMH3_HEVBR|nr:hypothetical protein P3X46_020638 [Hevea brasiliensis]
MSSVAANGTQENPPIRDVSISGMSVPYQAFLDGDWERLKRFFEQNTEAVVSPLTVNRDTALHIAIYSGSRSLVESIVQIARRISSPEQSPLLIQNEYGNTVLHEAAATGDVTAAKLLLDCERTLLDIKNKLGETPLYRAAAFGKTEMVKFLASEVLSHREEILATHRQKGPSVMSFHGRRNDSTSILHIAVHAEHFETALYLQTTDETLGELKDGNGRTCLHLLARMRSAYRSSQSMGKLKGLIYKCLPDGNEHEEDHQDTVSFSKKDDLESGPTTNHFLPFTYSRLRKGWPVLDRIRKEKKRHESVMKLTKLLVRLDKSWETSHGEPDIGTISFGEAERSRETVRSRRTSSLGGGKEDTNGNPVDKTIEPSRPLLIANSTGIIEIVDEILKAYPQAVEHVSDVGQNKLYVAIKNRDPADKTTEPTSTPLLIASSTGIIEIVDEILEAYPQAVEHVSDMGQNILHVAIKNRQRDIFRRVKKMKIPMAILVRKIDNNGYSLLHHAADLHNDFGGHKPSTVLQLQGELRWFERVKKIIPSHYIMHHNEKGHTAFELFELTHAKLHKDAQEWLKRTSESCSVIAVLIATVGFTAIYTVPGGTDEKTGLPILLHYPFFVVFTILDIISLASSLTAVVMFLSILTSPFRLQDFRISLPRKLTLGFTFLFISVAATMLAFAATIVLEIHLKAQWSRSLIYTVAFLPVTAFAIMQFPLYLAFTGIIKSSLKALRKALPWSFILGMYRSTKSSIRKKVR